MASLNAFLLDTNERLNKTNYSIWKVRMESIMIMQDLMDIVNGEEDEPIHPQESIKYKKRCKLALHCIKMNVANELLREVGDCSSAQES